MFPSAPLSLAPEANAESTGHFQKRIRVFLHDQRGGVAQVVGGGHFT
jgi:hypothetical protein